MNIMLAGRRIVRGKNQMDIWELYSDIGQIQLVTCSHWWLVESQLNSCFCLTPPPNFWERLWGPTKDIFVFYGCRLSVEDTQRWWDA